VLDQTYLRGPLAPLGRDAELVYYDQRLSGRSDGVVDSASVRLNVFVDDIEALRTTLGLGRIDLLAHSWGGLLALRYALRYPEHLGRLVLVSPMAPSGALWQEEQRALQASLQPADTAGMGELGASPAVAAGEPDAIRAMLRLSFRSELHDPELARTLDFHIEPDYRARSRQFGYLLPELLSYDMTGRLGEVEAPTLLIFGQEEPGGSIGGEVLRRGIPDVTSVTIPDTGHFGFVEAPERFIEVVRAFLAG
jgi:proline iminopeptidase